MPPDLLALNRDTRLGSSVTVIDEAGSAFETVGIVSATTSLPLRVGAASLMAPTTEGADGRSTTDIKDDCFFAAAGATCGLASFRAGSSFVVGVLSITSISGLLESGFSGNFKAA
jgi:hypothetical protein